MSVIAMLRNYLITSDLPVTPESLNDLKPRR